jgi:hypothetical protein
MGVRFHSGLQADWVPIEQIRQHPDNANNGDVEGLIASLQINGCYRSIWVSNREVEDGHHYAVGGNTLYEALLSLGVQMVPVSWVDCKSHTDELRILAVDNEMARRGYMDPGLEIAMLEMLLESDRGLAGSGYDDEDYAQKVADAQEPFHPEEADVVTMEFECVKCGHVNEVPLP